MNDPNAATATAPTPAPTLLAEWSRDMQLPGHLTLYLTLPGPTDGSPFDAPYRERLAAALRDSPRIQDYLKLLKSHAAAEVEIRAVATSRRQLEADRDLLLRAGGDNILARTQAIKAELAALPDNLDSVLRGLRSRISAAREDADRESVALSRAIAAGLLNDLQARAQDLLKRIAGAAPELFAELAAAMQAWRAARYPTNAIRASTPGDGAELHDHKASKAIDALVNGVLSRPANYTGPLWEAPPPAPTGQDLELAARLQRQARERTAAPVGGA
jgi:hypothetical protein